MNTKFLTDRLINVSREIKALSVESTAFSTKDFGVVSYRLNKMVNNLEDIGEAMIDGQQPMIFVSAPSIWVRDSTGLETFDNRFLKVVAKLHENYPNHVFQIPVLTGYTILGHLDSKDTSFDRWKNMCFNILKRCDQVWVLGFPGYENSTGVFEEIKEARRLNIPVHCVEIEV